MKGDFYLFKDFQNKIVKTILASMLNKKTFFNYTYFKHRVKSVDLKYIIAIGGCSGTSKSEIAYLLQEELYKLKINSMCISLDDYYKTNWKDRNKIRKQKGEKYIGINEIMWDKLNKITKHFKANKKKLYLQELNRFSGKMEYYVTGIRGVQVLIIEGLYSNYIKNKDLGIYINASLEDTYEFRKERNKENPDNEFRQLVLTKEIKDVKKTKKLANLVIELKKIK